MIQEPGIAIGLGMVLSLFLTETLGVTAGGIIVPGYIAIYLHDPLRVVITFAIALLTFFILQGLGNVILIYGKRRLVFCLLLGFILGYFSRKWLIFLPEGMNLVVIGNIIPGLIANWMDRQGVIKTISVILITASIVQLVLMLLYQGKIYV